MGRSRLIIAVVIALMAIITYFSSTSENPVTGEKQRVAMTPEQEIALGYKSAPQMAAQMGGLSQNEKARALVKQLGERLVAQSFAATSPYKFSFHVLADARTVNAFALPGGPIFITEGLLRLLKTEAELAGVLGHEIGHVTARHSVSQMSRAQLAQIGLGIGSSVGARIAGRSNQPHSAFAICQLLLVPALVLSAWLITAVIPYGEPTYVFQQHVSQNPLVRLPWDFVRCTLTILPGPVLWGMSFPLALASAGHFSFQIVPELNVGFAGGSDDPDDDGPMDEISRSGFHLDVGARATLLDARDPRHVRDLVALRRERQIHVQAHRPFRDHLSRHRRLRAPALDLADVDELQPAREVARTPRYGGEKSIDDREH